MKVLLKLMMKIYREQLEQRKILDDLQETTGLMVEIMTKQLEK